MEWIRGTLNFKGLLQAVYLCMRLFVYSCLPIKPYDEQPALSDVGVEGMNDERKLFL